MNRASAFYKETPESAVAPAPSEKTDTLSVAGYDPFDEPLDTQFKEDELLVLDDVYFEAARNSVSLDGMTFSYLQPPYVNFENQNNAKRKIKECYNQKLFLLIYGYSGSGKTTLQKQFESKYSDFVIRIEDFDDWSGIIFVQSQNSPRCDRIRTTGR